jgi:hypothetical protein
MKKILEAIQNAFYWCLDMLGRLAIFIAAEMMKQWLQDRTRQRRSIERKVKYFKPTIHESFWGKRVTWEMRDEPLTKEQIEKL